MVRDGIQVDAWVVLLMDLKQIIDIYKPLVDIIQGRDANLANWTLYS